MQKVEFEVSEFIHKLLRDACHNIDVNKFARKLCLKGLAAEFGSMDDDVTMKNVENIINQLE